MKVQVRLAGIGLLLICILSSATSFADQGRERDPLAGLKRAISQANAPTLTTQQETDLTTLITNFKNALPDEPDAALEAARDAFDAAILAGNATAAATAATAIANRTAVLLNDRLKAEATFQLAVLTLLKNGGQLAPLTTKYGDDRVLDIVRSLNGGGFGGGRGPGGH